jgi:hypothetical protein
MVDIWPALGVLCSASTVWAVYHTRMLDKNFDVGHSIGFGDSPLVLNITLTREWCGGPYGRIVCIKAHPKGGAKIACRVRKSEVGAVGYSGESWEEPVFSERAECDISFAPSTRALDVSFWIDCKTAAMFRAELMIEYSKQKAMQAKINAMS